MEQDLIKRFVEVHSQTKTLLDQEHIPEAKQKYLEVLNAYQAIDHSTLEPFHKELAHDQVTALFKRLNETKEKVKVPYNLIAAAILVIAFSVVVFFNPSIVGLASLSTTVHEPINVTYTESGLHTFTLRDRPLSIALSGSFTGNAKVFLKQGNQLRAIINSENTTSPFIESCLETCSVNAESNSVEFFVDISEGGSVTLNDIIYNVQRKPNTAPTWKGNSRSFKAPLGKPLTIDLNDYFTDAETDALTFASSNAEGLDVLVKDSIVTLTGKTAGAKSIIFVASDLEEVTRVSITIDVS